MKKNIIKNFIGVTFYHCLENVDGEKNNRVLIKYDKAQKLKVYLLINFIDD